MTIKDVCLKQYEQEMAKLQQLRQQLRQDIDNMLAQIPVILADESKLVCVRILEVMGIYLKADRLASKTDYDKEKHRKLLVEYAKFLKKYGMYYDAETILLRLLPLTEELYGKSHKNTAEVYRFLIELYGKYMEDYDNMNKLMKKWIKSLNL